MTRIDVCRPGNLPGSIGITVEQSRLNVETEGGFVWVSLGQRWPLIVPEGGSIEICAAEVE